MTYTLIGHLRSRAMRVAWTLEELGQPYAVEPVAPRSPEAAALHPEGKIPLLRDGDVLLGDSVAIMTYLADKHASLTFAPGTADRARQDAAVLFVLEEMDAVLWAAAQHSFALPEEHRVAAVKPTLKWQFQRALDRLEARLGDGPYLMGDTFTIADILAAHCLIWAVGAQFPTGSDALAAWGKGLRRRDGFLAARDRQ
ncbi:MAG: glutathione S-transferase family protein [Shimia sp.]